tara:strand:- start:106 stop:987 length:882 start_codon:yes stop_codon:yes gene_type:complete
MLKNLEVKLNKKNIPKIIVFGSNGFIASSLKKYLNKKKINSSFISKNKINLLNKNSIKLIKKNINNNNIVIFISAIAPVKNVKMFLDNLKMLHNFLEATKTINISQLIYISSDAVYSDTKKLIHENSETNPSSLHGLMHYSREKILLDNFKDKICILRPTLIYGSSDTHDGYGPNRFARLAKKNKQIDLFGKGEELRDHIWINDVVEIIYKSILYRSIGCLNISSGELLSFNEIARFIVKKFNSKSKIVFNQRSGPMPHLGLRKFDISNTYIAFKNFKYKSFKKVIYNIYKKY